MYSNAFFTIYSQYYVKINCIDIPQFSLCFIRHRRRVHPDRHRNKFCSAAASLRPLIKLMFSNSSKPRRRATKINKPLRQPDNRPPVAYAARLYGNRIAELNKLSSTFPQVSRATPVPFALVRFRGAFSLAPSGHRSCRKRPVNAHLARETAASGAG